MNNILIVASLLSLLCNVQSARILGVFPAVARSHYILSNALMKELAERGHDVTMISPFVEKNPPKKGSYRDIVLTGFVEAFEDKKKEINFFEMTTASPFLMAPLITHILLENSEATLNHTNVQKLIQSEDEKFDLVIVEEWMNDAHKALATYYGAPLIVFTSLPTNVLINDLVGNPTNLAFIPDFLMTIEEGEMSFCNKLMNVFLYGMQQAIQHFYVLPASQRMVKDYIPIDVDLRKAKYNASLVLLNAHSSMNQPVPYVPSMVDIGGFHITPPKKLPKDLQKYLDEAEEGIVYFSMGSNVKSADMPAAKKEAFLKALSKLKQKVLWKWENDELPGQPPNMKLGKWLPQTDILAHPNVKLFITHGGLLSTTETIYHGVPVLAIPILGDQKSNAQMAVNNGFGLALPFSEVTEEKLDMALNELLNNPKYKNNAQMKSKVFHDRPVKPMDLAMYWVEYVLRHGGTPHLRVGSLDLPWYKYFLLDIGALFAVVFILVQYVKYLVFRKIYRKLFGKKVQKIKQN